MSTYLLADILDGITDTIGAATLIERQQSYDELSEGMQDWPTIQVYPEGNTGTSRDSDTHKLTLSVKHTVKEYTIHVDVYARQRSHIGEDMKKLVEVIDQIENILDTQGCPPFDVSSIISFRWSWSRTTFDYGGVLYAGARFVLTVRAGSE